MEQKQELIKQYKENEQETKKINNSLDELRERNRKETYNLQYKIYWDKIKVLEEERDNKIKELDKQFKDKEKREEQKREELEGVIINVQRIINFLKIGKKEVIVKNDYVKPYNRDYGDKKYFKWLGYFYSDEFLKIRLLIAENDKPKNKYSLVVYGKCIFTDDIIKFPYSYGIHLNDNYNGLNLKTLIRDFSTIGELKKYLEKNKDKILKEKIEEYKKIKEEYFNTLENYKIEDFKELFKVECLKFGFFLFNKNQYSLYYNDKHKPLCPKCNAVLKERK
ncbi:MAG: hypothetical protein ABIA74_02685 [bacterium]